MQRVRRVVVVNRQRGGPERLRRDLAAEQARTRRQGRLDLRRSEQVTIEALDIEHGQQALDRGWGGLCLAHDAGP